MLRDGKDERRMKGWTRRWDTRTDKINDLVLRRSWASKQTQIGDTRLDSLFTHLPSIWQWSNAPFGIFLGLEIVEQEKVSCDPKKNEKRQSIFQDQSKEREKRSRSRIKRNRKDLYQILADRRTLWDKEIKSKPSCHGYLFESPNHSFSHMQAKQMGYLDQNIIWYSSSLPIFLFPYPDYPLYYALLRPRIHFPN